MQVSNEKGSQDEANPLGLDDSELETLQEQTELPTTNFGYWAVYQYSTSLDIAIILISATMAALAGACLPLMTVGMIYGGNEHKSKLYRSSSEASASHSPTLPALPPVSAPSPTRPLD